MCGFPGPDAKGTAVRISTRNLALVVTAGAAAVATALPAAPVAATGAPAPRPTSPRTHPVTPAVLRGPHARFVSSVGRTTDVHFSCQDNAGCYSPAQIRKAYGVDDLAADGTGRTIVIIDAFQSPTLAQDVQLFDQSFDLPDADLQVIAPDGLTPFDPSNPDQVGWSGEITLDVEWAHAIAPGATIDLVLAKSDNDADILSATRYAVRQNLGDVISQSFGEGETCMDPVLVRAQHRIFRSATGKGITLLASSGDQGAAQPDCNNDGGFFKSASTPATDPFVTAVGGTRLVADSTGTYESESAWNEFATYESAGGGGFSTLYRTPAYQRRLHLRSRGVPDVAYNAAINGGVLGVWSPGGTAGYYRFGGTSAGSPQWAGLVADADQVHGGRIGFLNDRLYAWAGRSRLAGRLFHDVTTGNNSFGSITGYAARKGWDAVTGLGSPRADALVPRLAR